MEKRNKAKLFRKARKNYFRRGYKISVKSDAKIFILIKKNEKSYTFTNTSIPFFGFQGEAVGNINFKNASKSNVG